MNPAIQNPARCVLHSVISPLSAESSRAFEIYGRIVALMVKMVWQDSMWLNEFVCWRNKERKFMMWSGEGALPLSATKYCESPENIRKDRRLTIDKLHALCSVISRTVLNKTENLGCRKYWLTCTNETELWSHNFSPTFWKQVEKFFDSIVTVMKFGFHTQLQKPNRNRCSGGTSIHYQWKKFKPSPQSARKVIPTCRIYVTRCNTLW